MERRKGRRPLPCAMGWRSEATPGGRAFSRRRPTVAGPDRQKARVPLPSPGGCGSRSSSGTAAGAPARNRAARRQHTAEAEPGAAAALPVLWGGSATAVRTRPPPASGLAQSAGAGSRKRCPGGREDLSEAEPPDPLPGPRAEPPPGAVTKETPTGPEGLTGGQRGRGSGYRLKMMR